MMAFKVLLAQFMHETNTFCKRLTDANAFRGFYCHEDDDVTAALAGTQNEIAGVLDVAREHGWALVTPVATFATPGGPVTADAWTAFGERILAAARDQGPFHGVVLSLHGAMVLDDGSDGDARLLRELRGIVGPGVPIAVTLDLHANLDPGMAALADIIVSYRSFPHVDMRNTGRRAAGALHEVLTAGPPLRTIIRKVPMITLPEGGRSDREPMSHLVRLSEHLEAANPDVLDVSINAGFSFSDVPEIGPSATVVHRGDSGPALDIADRLVAEMWACRDADQEPMLSPSEAARASAAHDRQTADGPLVLADISDNPGDGAYADATALLDALVRDGGPDILLGALHDPDTVEQARRAGTGAEVRVAIGGKADTHFGGAPLHTTARVRLLGDGEFEGGGPMWEGVKQSCGPSAVLQIDGVDVLVTSRATQALDLEIFRSIGVDPLGKRVIALKSTQHFRAAYTPVAGRILLVDGGGLTSPRLDRLVYNRIPRPIHPLD